MEKKAKAEAKRARRKRLKEGGGASAPLQAPPVEGEIPTDEPDTSAAAD